MAKIVANRAKVADLKKQKPTKLNKLAIYMLGGRPVTGAIMIAKFNIYSYRDAIYDLTKKGYEILEKNGFKDIDKLGVEKCVGYNIYFKNGDGWGFNEHCFSLHYVHELQHALRLYGLNDIADNFQI